MSTVLFSNHKERVEGDEDTRGDKAIGYIIQRGDNFSCYIRTLKRVSIGICVKDTLQEEFKNVKDAIACFKKYAQDEELSLATSDQIYYQLSTSTDGGDYVKFHLN